MKQINKSSLLVFIVVAFVVNGFAQADSRAQSQAADPGDRSVKEKSPAGKIEQYWFILLKTGPKQDFDSIAKAKLFEGHMANIKRLYNEGILKVAGPFGKNDLKWRGIFIFDCKTKEDAQMSVSTDPAVAAGLFAAEIVPWFTESTGSFIHGKPEKPID